MRCFFSTRKGVLEEHLFLISLSLFLEDVKFNAACVFR